MPHGESGHSLLELLVVSAALAIITQAGLGLFELVERNRRWQAVAELQRLVNFTRSAAVNRQQAVTLCALDSEGACTGAWTGRDVAVFTDSDRNRRVDEGELLRREHWPNQHGQLYWRASLGRYYLEYSEMGSTHQNGSFLLCRDASVRLVMKINRGGRPYVADAAGQECN